jgi:hypothetical protein
VPGGDEKKDEKKKEPDAGPAREEMLIWTGCREGSDG